MRYAFDSLAVLTPKELKDRRIVDAASLKQENTAGLIRVVNIDKTCLKSECQFVSRQVKF